MVYLYWLIYLVLLVCTRASDAIIFDSSLYHMILYFIFKMGLIVGDLLSLLSLNRKWWGQNTESWGTYKEYTAPLTYLWAVWPDLAIYWTSGNFLKPLATINLPKSPPFLGNFCKVSKSFIFLVKPFLGYFYRHLAIFNWSHWAGALVFTFIISLDHLLYLIPIFVEWKSLWTLYLNITWLFSYFYC